MMSMGGVRQVFSILGADVMRRRSACLRDGEPEIYQATQMFGTILENVVLNQKTRTVDYARWLL